MGRRDDFSIPSGEHYLNCAYLAPLSKRVRRAAMDAFEQLDAPWRVPPAAYFEGPDRLRTIFAQLVDAPDARRIALVPSVSYAMATACRNLRARPGQNVVVIGDEFPSAVLAWRQFARMHQVTLRTVYPPTSCAGANRGETWNRALHEAIDDNTAVVVLAPVHWSDGTLFDIAGLSARAREMGAMVVVDGTQAIGALPFSVRHVQPDMLVTAGYKWLMGPYGLSVAYFGPRFDDGVPIEDVWTSQVGSDNFATLASYQDTYRPFGERFDGGQRASFILVPMLTAAIEQLLEWRVDRVQTYCADLIEPFVPRLRAMGIGLESPGMRAAHVLGLQLPSAIDMDASTIAVRLKQWRVHVSPRGNMIRVAPNVYNVAEDVSMLCEALEAVLAKRGTDGIVRSTS